MNSGNNDASFDSNVGGQADLPAGVTGITLNNNTELDLSAGVSSSVENSLEIAGGWQSLSNLTTGDLENKDLSGDQIVGGATVKVEKAVVLQSGTNTEPIHLSNSDLSNVDVEIPDGTTVLAPSGWDGKITPPKTGSNSGSAPSGFSVGNTVIEVGSSSGVLLFDRPVTVLLTGVTGKVGYKPAGSTTWVEIATACGGTYETPTSPTFPGECYISNGTDTKIYTYHFTSFASLNTSSSNTSGGGTRAASGGYVPPVVTPAATTPTLAPVGQVLGASTGPIIIAGCGRRTTGVSVTTGQSCVGNSGEVVGQVLGAEKFHFTLTIKKGSKGNEVKELQKFLNNASYNVGVVDGKFGNKTKAMVIKFQIANKLKGDGVVGYLTRAVLNK